jgi:anaerobic magnesium-protoporphyrin IX monomethyl ester cyclase
VIWSSVADVLRDEAVLPRWRDAGVIHVGICREPSEDRLEGAALERSVSEGRRAVRALRQAGITCETSFWLGFPDETLGTVDETSSRARAWDADVAHFPLLTPLPYTPAWRTYGAHVITRDYRRYNQRDPVVKPRAMELQEVVEAAEGCRRQFAADRPSRNTPGTVRRAGPWLVHPGEPEPGGPVPEGLGGDGREGDPASPPVPRN